ncbi:MAG: methylated-DNA--[protein]-cysteine S-methyltransferase [Bdellovibrionales bacterium]
MPTAQKSISSEIGVIHLVASEKGLKSLDWQATATPQSIAHAPAAAFKILDQAEKELVEYFKGQRKKFDVALDLDGTDFQKKVWQQLRKIPYGKTYSYQELARQIQNEKATRAVGTANGRNRLPIIIPCHRVIAANGTLGGYSGGLDIKIKLLELEKATFRP